MIVAQMLAFIPRRRTLLNSTLIAGVKISPWFGPCACNADLLCESEFGAPDLCRIISHCQSRQSFLQLAAEVRSKSTPAPCKSATM